MAVPVLNGKTQFFDAAGVSLGLGTVSLYVPGTLTAKQTWQDQAKTSLNTTPTINLDAGGYAMIYGTGAYRQIVKDSLGNTIWDQVAWANDYDAGSVAFSATATYPAGSIGKHEQGFVSVTDAPFNATGTSENATTSLTAAISFAQTLLASGYWVNAYNHLTIPAGQYGTSGNTITKNITFGGAGVGSTSLFLESGANTSLLTVNPAPLTDPSQQSYNAFPTIGSMNLAGVSASQTGTSYGLDFADAGWAIGTRYSVAGRVIDMQINDFKTDGVHVGVNRNLAYFQNVTVRYCGKRGWNINSYDNYFFGCEAGNNWVGASAGEGAGLLINGGGGNFITQFSSYLNEIGFVVSPFSNQTNVCLGGASDSNSTRGWYIDSGSQNHMMNAIVGHRFQGNSVAAGNTYSDVYILNSPTPSTFVGTMHSYNAVSRPKYLFELNAVTDFVIAAGTSYSMTDVPWGTGFSNRPLNVILAGNSVARIAHTATNAQDLAGVIGTSTKWKINATGIAFNGAAPIGITALPAAATDLASVIALANATRTMLINLGFAS